MSVAINERGGYQLMPEWGTRPANHYLPRRKMKSQVTEESLNRIDNPLKKEEQRAPASNDLPSLDDFLF